MGFIQLVYCMPGRLCPSIYDTSGAEVLGRGYSRLCRGCQMVPLVVIDIRIRF